MAVRLRLVVLDDEGAGTIHMPPAYLAGVIDGEAEGVNDEMVPRNDQLVVAGPIVVSGDPGATVQMYYDFE